MTVLLVDDDPAIRLAAAHALRAAGHAVIEAADGAAATRAAAGPPVDLVILDVLLGDEDGVALAHTLRAAAGLAAVPFLFLTGRADRERERLLATGAAGVLAKPFDLTTFAAAVERFVNA